MIEIKYSTRVFLDKRDQRVMIRVRWHNKQREVGFTTGVYAQPEKWDNDLHRAKKNTTHEIRGMKFSAAQINDRIGEFKEAIEDCFSTFMLKNVVPLADEVKTAVNGSLCRDEDVTEQPIRRRMSIKELFDTFLIEVGREKNWDKLAKEKYTQAYNHIIAASPYISPESITINTMYQLRDWYVENGYKNRTVDKQITMLKSFLRWINQQEGYSIPQKVLDFKPNLNVLRKTVNFLRYDELMSFAEYDFQDSEEYLAHARDLWCFMAFTSLRYSDLAALKTAHIIGNRIDMYTQKTNEHITIPLTEQAQKIIMKYKGRVSDPTSVFDVISNQKLNDYIKIAAERAGLNREVINTYFVGTERKEEIHKFYEIISCHDARRTFVSCSLAMGIPAEVVMKCTGHHSYSTMKPYIETATETQTMEMEKWNKNQYRSQITAILDLASENDMKAILQLIKEYAKAI